MHDSQPRDLCVQVQPLVALNNVTLVRIVVIYYGRPRTRPQQRLFETAYTVLGLDRLTV